MSVTIDDLRHIAGLARVGLDERDVQTLVAQINAILKHMEVLSTLDTNAVAPMNGVSDGGTPLREDCGPPQPLLRPRDAFAPVMRDGFFLVPRLATHGDAGDADTGDAA